MDVKKWKYIKYRGVGIFEGLDRALLLGAMAIVAAGLFSIGSTHPWKVHDLAVELGINDIQNWRSHYNPEVENYDEHGRPISHEQSH
jgi:hypothetical protein